MAKSYVWTYIVALLFTVADLSGANFAAVSEQTLVVCGLGLLVLVISLWRLRLGLPNQSIGWAFLIICFGIGVMTLQLVPLPSSIWSMLPGRSFVDKDLSSLGMGGSWMPLSLSPYATKQDIIFLLPALAGFFGIISLPQQNWRILGWIFIFMAVVSSAVALTQRFQGENGIFNFYHYHYPNAVVASGFFANRNFLAAQLYCTIPFVAAMILKTFAKTKVLNFILSFLGIVVILIVVAGLGATGSRMGALLLVVSLLSLPFLFLSWRSSMGSTAVRIPKIGIVAIFVSIIIFAQLCLAALQRFSQVDLAADYRGTMLKVSYTTLKAFFPVGSGFGSFVPAYQLFETPDVLKDFYVNHAHNDWIELLIEGGLPIAIVLVCFLCWFFYRLYYIWSNSGVDLLAKAAGISASLLLIHSMVDYPLRTPGLLTFFGMCCGMMAANAYRTRIKVAGSTKSPPAKVGRDPVPFTPRPGGFKKQQEIKNDH